MFAREAGTRHGEGTVSPLRMGEASSESSAEGDDQVASECLFSGQWSRRGRMKVWVRSIAPVVCFGVHLMRRLARLAGARHREDDRCSACMR